MNKKIAALLAIVLLISLAGCGGTSGVDDVPPDNSIEASQTTPETPTEPSTEPTQEPTAEPSTEPTTEPTQEPTTAQTEEPGEQVPTNEEPTTEATQAPTTPPVNTAPAHTHSYSNSVTKQATCDTKGIITYTCSCGDSYTEAIKETGHNYSSTVVTEPTCVEVGGRLYTCANCGNVYTETIPANGHNYVTQTVEHTEERLIGTETVNDYAQVTIYGCNACSFTTYEANEMLKHNDARYAKGPCVGANYWSKTTTEVVGTHEEPKYATRTTSELVHVCSICGHQE